MQITTPKPVSVDQMEAVLKAFEANDVRDALAYLKNAPGFTAECALYIHKNLGAPAMIRFLQWIVRHSPH